MNQSYFWSDILLLLYSIVWIILYKKYKKMPSVSIIMLSYAIYAVCSLIIFNSSEILSSADFTYGGLHLFPFVYLFFMLYVFLSPVLIYEKQNVSFIQRPTDSLITVIIVVYVLCRLILLPNLLNMTWDGMSLLYSSEEGGAFLYGNREDYMDEYAVSSGLLPRIAGVISSFISDIFYFLFFYYLTLPKKKLWIVLFSIFIMTVDVISPFGYGNRTDPVLITFVIIMAASLFYRYYSHSIKRIIKRSAVIALVVLSIPMVMISISRFAMTDSLKMGTLGYVGQANLNFNQYVFYEDETRHGDRILNLYKGWFGLATTKGVLGTREKYKTMKMGDDHFSTFVGDMVLDFGLIGTAFLILVSTMLLLQLTKTRNHTIKFCQLLLLYYTLSVSMAGGFYLFPYAFNRAGIFISYIFFYFLFSLDLSVSYNKKRKVNYLSITTND